jgi:hypothetical protein
MQKLIDLGFEQAAVANLRHGAAGQVIGIEIAITKFAKATNILYAFVFHRNEPEVDLWQVRYIGHTRKTFANRMAGYQAGHGKAVNNRVHVAVKDHLRSGGQVVVYVMSDRFLFSMHDLHVDIAAGLEYSLIAYYREYNHRVGHPRLLNKAGNPKHKDQQKAPTAAEIRKSAQEEAADRIEEEKLYVPTAPPPEIPANAAGEALPPAPLCQFDFELTEKVYWPIEVINVKKRCERFFGPHGDVVRVDLVDAHGMTQTVSVSIDRNANLNHTPRLPFAADATGARDAYRAWKLAHRVVGATVTVLVVGQNHIRLVA